MQTYLGRDDSRTKAGFSEVLEHAIPELYSTCEGLCAGAGCGLPIGFSCSK